MHDALANNRRAVDLIGKQELPIIAVQVVRSNSKAKRWRREDVPSRMPVVIKKVLRRHGFPRDLAADLGEVVTR